MEQMIKHVYFTKAKLKLNHLLEVKTTKFHKNSTRNVVNQTVGGL